MALNNLKNYYEILEVSTDARTSEIKFAYRRLARKYHPDINKSPESIEIFKEITCAYETLINPDLRHKYDIINGIFKKETENVKNENEKVFDQTHCNKNNKVNKKINFFTIPNFKTLKWLLTKFKRVKTNFGCHRPQKGENINADITITPDEVLTGSERLINIRTTKTCPQCLGHKFTKGGKCPKCGGEGKISENKKITVKIPKGIKNGAKLRIKKEGASGKNGGANGDLIINIKIKVKTQIHYDKLDIYFNVPITPYEAALGEEISIPAFDGKIKLKLPKKTSSGQKFRISGQGIKKHGKVGDLIVTVNIEFSSDLSDDEIKLYNELKKLSKHDLRENFGYGT